MLTINAVFFIYPIAFAFTRCFVAGVYGAVTTTTSESSKNFFFSSASFDEYHRFGMSPGMSPVPGTVNSGFCRLSSGVDLGDEFNVMTWTLNPVNNFATFRPIAPYPTIPTVRPYNSLDRAICRGHFSGHFPAPWKDSIAEIYVWKCVNVAM